MQIAVVIPTYKAKNTILALLGNIPDDVTKIIVVDDCCPQNCAALVKDNLTDDRIIVHRNDTNLGVGGATKMGFKIAFDRGCDVCVKIDSDGQIDPDLIMPLIAFMQDQGCGYSKGSRFTTSKHFDNMPRPRIFLNAILSFTNKFASGYYSINDPTNGLIAIDRPSYHRLSIEKVANRFFFESDMLHHLGLARVRCRDFPMRAIYADEVSNLQISKEAGNFAKGSIKNFIRRVFLRHFVMNFSVPAIYLLVGVFLCMIGGIIGISHLFFNAENAEPAAAGVVILPAFLLLVGINFLTQFFVLDVQDEPS